MNYLRNIIIPFSAPIVRSSYFFFVCAEVETMYSIFETRIYTSTFSNWSLSSLNPLLLRWYATPDIDHQKTTQWTKTVCDSTLHPDTGKPIFLPFRMACFVPTNLLVAAGMLMPNPTVKSIMFWQWANQSVNVAFNYANANKTIEMDMKETAGTSFFFFSFGCPWESVCRYVSF